MAKCCIYTDKIESVVVKTKCKMPKTRSSLAGIIYLGTTFLTPALTSLVMFGKVWIDEPCVAVSCAEQSSAAVSGTISIVRV